MTLAQLKAATAETCFPDGTAENLKVNHENLIIDCLMDLQQKVKCLQVNNTQVYPFCATLFQCGMTVIQKPRGRILRVSTFSKISADGEAIEDAPVNWCSEVRYRQVDYCQLEKHIDKTLSCLSCNLPAISADVCSDCGNALNLYYGKNILTPYPPPTNADYVGFPELPLGFYYPQSSTDYSRGRAFAGVWAINRERIYIAPWIQSTEVVVVEWDGLKRDWTDDDLVDDDPMLRKAVAAYVLQFHYSRYEQDLALSAKNEQDYINARADLFDECRKENVNQGCQQSVSRMSNMTLQAQSEATITTTTTTGA